MFNQETLFEPKLRMCRDKKPVGQFARSVITQVTAPN